VTTLDARTGERVTVERVAVWPRRPWSPNAGGIIPSVVPGGPTFDLRVPPMDVDLSAEGETWYGSLLVDPTRETVVEWRVSRSSGVRVRLLEGEKQVPWETWYGDLTVVSVEPVEPDEEPAFRWGRGYVGLERGGRFRVTLPPNDQFEPVPPFEVDVPYGTWVERDVRVVRRR
jgi:hypothetical protein